MVDGVMITIDISGVRMQDTVWFQSDDTGERRILAALREAGVNVPEGLHLTERYHYRKPGVTCVELRCAGVSTWFDAPSNAVPLDKVVAKLDVMRLKIAAAQKEFAEGRAALKAEEDEARKLREYVGTSDHIRLLRYGSGYTLILDAITLDQARDIANEARRVTGRTAQ